MGCCISSKKPPASYQFHRRPSKSSRDPPPAEEEAVKEVLSETPNPNHFSKIEDEPIKITPKFNKIRRQQANNHEDSIISDEVSEICCTMSESVSTTTFEEDIKVLRRRVIGKEQSPAKLRDRRLVSGELRVVGNSPARGDEQSPGRVRSVQRRDSFGNGFSSAGRQMPGSGNGSAARSRSPANRMVAGNGGAARNGIGRSLSARKTGKSPVMVGSDLNERIRKPVVGLSEEREERREEMDSGDSKRRRITTKSSCFVGVFYFPLKSALLVCVYIYI